MTVAESLVAGRYRLGPCLGAGGMGRVWLARDELLRRDVAVKEIALPFGLSDDEHKEMRDRTLREARAAARLNHPNVVRIYDVQPGDERPWIVMEFVRSRSLHQLVQQSGPLPVSRVAEIGLAILSALAAANRVGVLHRDIKPSNVLVAEDGRVVLTDFGSAIIDEGEGVLTRTGVILGSPRYIAPERARDGVATMESDLWSLGATLYEAVEGRTPYTRETTLETLVALATEDPDPVRLAGPLRPVLRGLLQKKPQNRMKPAQVEERLRRVAERQNRLRVPALPLPRRPTSSEETPRRGSDPVTVVSESTTVPRESAPPTERVETSASWWLRPPRRTRRRTIAAGAAVIVLAVAALALGVKLLPVGSRSDGDWSPTTAGNSTPEPAGALPTSASAATAVDPNALPAGFEWWSAKNGFRAAVPSGWEKIQEGPTSVLFCAPGGPPLVGIREWTPGSGSLVAALSGEEARAALGPTYRRIQIVTVRPEQQRAGALWEYTFTDPKMGPLHGFERAVVVSGHNYLIQFRTPADKWQQNLFILDIVTTSIRSPGGSG
jgi:eukaryotic-like serine/threonine-protein kinase